MQFEGNPDSFHAWVEDRLGAESLALLRERAYNVELAKEIKRTKGKGEIAAHFKSEYERLL
jgi:hypothetical protein